MQENKRRKLAYEVFDLRDTFAKLGQEITRLERQRRVILVKLEKKAAALKTAKNCINAEVRVLTDSLKANKITPLAATACYTSILTRTLS